MSADIEKIVYAGATPWHLAGVEMQENFTVEVAIEKAGLNWHVEAVPIETVDQKKTAIENYRVTRRVEDNAILGIVKAGFVPIQNAQAFGMFNTVISGKALINTAGSLQGGSKVWMLAKMPGAIEVGKNDPIEKYLLLSNNHDGKRPLQMLFTPVRVVCSNTLAMALGSGKDKIAPSVSIPHTLSASVRMKDAERVMAHAVKYYERFGDFADYLCNKQLVEEQLKNIIQTVFPPNDKMVVTKKMQHHRMTVRRLFDEGKGHDRIDGTAWALINAFGEYADHSLAYKADREDPRGEQMRSIWFGGARGLKQRATKIVMKAVA